MEPYPGIRPFQSDDAPIYFGREQFVEDVIERLHRDHLVTLAGPSASGKSSLIRAGLLPRIAATAPESSPYRIIAITPGVEPFRRLLNAFGQASEPSLDRDLTRDHWLALFPDAVKQSESRWFLIVDQFEEIFRTGWQSGSVEQCVAFVAALADIRALPSMSVVLSLRADFLGDCGRLAGLTELVNSSVVLVPPLSREERLSAITKPLLVVGGQCEREFAEQLVSESGDQYPDDLVLMQHVLARMWARTRSIHPDQPSLTRTGYEAVGGLDRALGLHAEEVFAALTIERQSLARRLFRSLTASSSRGFFRRPDTLENISQVLNVNVEEIKKVIQPFQEAGLLADPSAIAEPGLVDITHEVIIRRWDRLRQWAMEEADAGAMYSRLLQSAQLYNEAKTTLLQDPELNQVLAWIEGEQPSASWAERYGGQFALVMDYVNYSVELRRLAKTNTGRPQPRGGVFICYRRDDSERDARSIAETLVKQFGHERVFMDIDSIDPGSNFEEVLRARISSSAVVLVLIGIHWLNIEDSEGHRRLENSGDYVRREIRDAINADLRVIPVLLGRATMPNENDLPPDICRITKLQSVALKYDSFQPDLKALRKELAQLVEPSGFGGRLKSDLTRALQWTRLLPRH